MALDAERPQNSGEPAQDTRYVARQPIFDLRGRVHGYELLFRNGLTNAFSGDGETATRQMLDNTVLFGAEHLSSGALSFVNCTRHSLVNGLVEVLPPSHAVLEILESVEPDTELIHALKKLKARGFRFALDDFVWKPEFERLVDLADYIKVDFIKSGYAERMRLRGLIGSQPVAMVAEKLETRDEYHLAHDEGFSFFQGYYFCRPTLIENRKVPENRVSQLQLLGALQEKEFDVHRITGMVKRDAAITYRLLRMVNSPLYAMQKEIRSVENALITVGEMSFRRIVTLAITSELNAGGTDEILRMVFERARFCELASAEFALDTNEQYLVGLFSLLPTMLRTTMESALGLLPLRDAIRAALLGEAVAERCPLAWIEAIEKGYWERGDKIADQCGVNQQHLLRLAKEASQWSNAVLSSTCDGSASGCKPPRRHTL